ncbi:hypothetical protein LguiB_008952 [Lonicera macranthoides]
MVNNTVDTHEFNKGLIAIGPNVALSINDLAERFTKLDEFFFGALPWKVPEVEYLRRRLRVPELRLTGSRHRPAHEDGESSTQDHRKPLASNPLHSMLRRLISLYFLCFNEQHCLIRPWFAEGKKYQIYFSFNLYRSVVGEYAKLWNTRGGDFVRAHVPISYSDWRIILQNFKDDNDNPVIVVPKGVDTNIWRKFVENEIQPKKKLQNKKNSENCKMLKSSHCLGRRTYAQKQYMMKQKNPEKQFRRIDKLLASRERSDGTMLESAKSKYDEVNVAQNRRKRTITNKEEINTCEYLDNDELVEVFGKDNKGRVRGMGFNISKKQIVHVGVATATYAEDLKAREEAISLKDEFTNHMNSKLNKFEDFMNVVLSKLDMGKHGAPPTMITPNIDLGSCSMHCPSISQHVNNLFSTVGMSHPSSSFTSTNNPPVILCDKFSKELARGPCAQQVSSTALLGCGCRLVALARTQAALVVECCCGCSIAKCCLMWGFWWPRTEEPGNQHFKNPVNTFFVLFGNIVYGDNQRPHFAGRCTSILHDYLRSSSVKKDPSD